MASYSFLAPRPTNAILSDVDHIREIHGILAQLNPSLADGAPEDSKRLVPLDSAKTQYRFERLVGSSWNSVGKLMHDVDTLDGYHASISAVKNTIPVYNADAKLVGDLTGNANTATALKNVRKLQIGGIASGGSVNFDGSADATIEITQLTVNNANDTAINGILTVKHGGTGGADAATARANLGVPAIDHSSTAKTFGVSSTTKYGHAIGSDTLNSTFTADKGYFFSPKGANDLNNTLRAFIAQEVATCLPLSGGAMAGTIYGLGDVLSGYTDDSFVALNGGQGWGGGARIVLSGSGYPDWNGDLELQANDGTNRTLVRVRTNGDVSINGNSIITSGGVKGALSMLGTWGDFLGKVGGAIGDNNGCLRLTGGPYKASDSGAYIQLYAKDHASRPGWIEIQSQDGSSASSVFIKPDGTFTHKGNNVITSAGGTLTGNILFDTQAGKTFLGYIGTDQFRLGVGTLGSAASAGVLFDCYTQQHATMPGQLTIVSNNGNGKTTVALRPTGLSVNEKKVLTEAGGTLTGALQIAYGSQIQANSDTIALNIYGGAGYQHGGQLVLIGRDASWLPGGFQLGARNAEKAVWLQGDLNGNLTWGGNAVWTSFNGNVVNSNTVAVGNVTGNTFTLPAGGTWAYTYHRSTYGDNAGGSGTAAGGTTITAKEGPISYFAIRIA